LEAASAVVRPCALVGVPYGTDAAFYASTGVPSVVFGPGSIAQAHTADEWVDLDQVEKAAEVYYRFVKSFC
jgi:acetylornithine deacetylase